MYINFSKEIPLPNTFNELKNYFHKYFGQNLENVYIFYYKDKNNNIKEIINDKNIYDIRNENNRIIYVKKEGDNLYNNTIKKINNNLEKNYEELIYELKAMKKNFEEVKHINKLEIDKRLNLEKDNEILIKEKEELIKEFEKIIKIKNNEINNKELEIKFYREYLQKLIIKVNEKKEIISNFENQKEEIKNSQLKKEVLKLEILKKEKEKVIIELNETKNNIQNYKEKIVNLEKQINQHTNENKEKIEKIEKLEKDNERLNILLNEKDNNLKDNQNLINDLINKYNDVEKKNNNLIRENEQLNIQLKENYKKYEENKKKLILENEKKYKELKTQKEELDIKYIESKDEQMKLEQINNKNNLLLNKLNQQNDCLKLKIDEYEKEINNQKNINKENEINYKNEIKIIKEVIINTLTIKFNELLLSELNKINFQIKEKVDESSNKLCKSFEQKLKNFKVFSKFN